MTPAFCIGLMFKRKIIGIGRAVVRASAKVFTMPFAKVTFPSFRHTPILGVQYALTGLSRVSESLGTLQSYLRASKD
jgi:hypothetical protein